VLAALPGGCNLPLGCLARITTDGVELRAVLEISGRGLVRASALAPHPAAAADAVLSRLTGDHPTQAPEETS